MMFHFTLDVQRDGGQMVMLESGSKSLICIKQVSVTEIRTIWRAVSGHKTEISETAKHTKVRRLLTQGHSMAVDALKRVD